MRINKDLKTELIKILGVTPRRVDQIIAKRVSDNEYLFERNIIALDLAAENKIDIRKYASKKEVEELLKYRTSKPVPEEKAKQVKSITSKPRRIIVRLDREIEIECSNLPKSVLEDARKMSSVYKLLYVFENSIRFFIKDIMESKYGKNWWDEKIGVRIRRKAADRQAKEGRNRWHGKRGNHPIFYVDINNLRAIIASFPGDFKDRLPDVDQPIEWLANRINEIELSRNIIAHNNPLDDDDIARIKVYFKDWVKQFLKKK